jgi:starch phosphorylase
MIQKYLGKDIEKLGVSFEQFMGFGSLHDTKTFWLPAFAVRFSHRTNGVSRLHGEVSRKMWQKCFPHSLWPEIPITHITNGIHYSWISPEVRDLFERYMGPDYIYAGENDEIWERIWNISDEEIWEAHMARKRSMINFLRRTAGTELSDRGASPRRIRESQEMLQAGSLTIGFARRFASYKRPNLILWDRERLKRLLTDEKRPIQLIFAGKAHPADEQGKQMIKALIDFARDNGVENRLLFVENYDRTVAEYIVQGVDVWLNNPTKYQEASGTSGMKAGVNGVLNLSVLDGWWPECYAGRNGWAITAGEAYQSPEMRDAADADQIYDLLEEEIIPMYYERDERNIPREWVSMMKSSISSVARGFSVVRMLSQYCTELYIPAVKLNQKLLEADRKLLTRAVDIHRQLRRYWDRIGVKDVFSDIDGEKPLFTEGPVTVTCYAYLDDMPEDLVTAEVFYHRPREQSYETVALAFVERYKDKTAKYEGKFQLKSSGRQGYAARLVPADPYVRGLYPDLVKWKE